MAKQGKDAGPIQPATALVQAGRRPEWTGDPRLGGGVVNPPIWRASTILYDSIADLKSRPANTHDALFYGRRGTPTVWALADAITGIEADASAGTLLFPSGVAAITTAMLAYLKPGDDVLVVDSAYEPTRGFCNGMLAAMGITTRYYDPLVGAGIATLITPATRMIVLESPGSLTFEVQDIPAIVSVAKAHGIVTMIDNTWATPLLLPALSMGVDISMMSLTKYVGGHSDILMGSLSCNAATWDVVRKATYQLGHNVSPDDCALALRGIRTLDVRLRRHGESALTIAHWMSGRAEVGRVLHPALPDCPGHALFTRDFGGASGLFGFSLTGASVAQRTMFIEALAHFGIGYSWGGYESLIVPVDPANCRSAVTWSDPDPYVRISIGLEDAGDLIADIEQAFAKAGLSG